MHAQDSRRAPPSWSRALLKFIASTLIAAMLIGAAIARLQRVARPTFVPVERVARTSAMLGRVSLLRPGEAQGTMLGWSVLCAGRELAVFPGARRPTLRSVQGDGGSSIVATVNGDERVLDLSQCP